MGVSVGVEVAGVVGVSDGLGIGDAGSEVWDGIMIVEVAITCGFCVLSTGADEEAKLQERIARSDRTLRMHNLSFENLDRLFIFSTMSTLC
jgi:hypothetical protein